MHNRRDRNPQRHLTWVCMAGEKARQTECPMFRPWKPGWTCLLVDVPSNPAKQAQATFGVCVAYMCA
jgi:hypothetical protein